MEMHKIAQRQFHWQRGFLNVPQFIRAAYLFNFPEADRFFRDRNGLSISEFMRCGFTVFVHLSEHPFVSTNTDMTSVGIESQARDATMRLIANSHADSRAKQND